MVLGYRLVSLALADLAPDRAPERAEITLRTAFPGSGLRDAAEMTGHAVSRDTFVVDETLATPEAPMAVVGRLWFELALGSASRAYAVMPVATRDEFVRIGQTVKVGAAYAANERCWTDLEKALTAAVMAAPDDALFRRARAAFRPAVPASPTGPSGLVDAPGRPSAPA